MSKNLLNIHKFYSEQRPDNDGYFFSDILLFNKAQFEMNHHFMQWLFPIETFSLYNLTGPVLSKTEVKELKENPVITENMLQALEFVCDMYGLEIKEKNGLQIIPKTNFDGYWLTKNNHNHLRLTRIIKSLCYAGHDQYAKALCDCLLDIKEKYPDVISEKTVECWKKAIPNEKEEYER